MRWPYDFLIRAHDDIKFHPHLRFASLRFASSTSSPPTRARVPLSRCHGWDTRPGGVDDAVMAHRTGKNGGKKGCPASAPRQPLLPSACHPVAVPSSHHPPSLLAVRSFAPENTGRKDTERETGGWDGIHELRMPSPTAQAGGGNLEKAGGSLPLPPMLLARSS